MVEYVNCENFIQYTVCSLMFVCLLYLTLIIVGRYIQKYFDGQGAESMFPYIINLYTIC